MRAASPHDFLSPLPRAAAVQLPGYSIPTCLDSLATLGVDLRGCLGGMLYVYRA